MKNTNYPFLVEFTGTPESGKTTCVKELCKRLINQGFKVKYVQETAEIIDDTTMPKNNFEYHLAIRLLALVNICEAKYENYDFILIDRGIIDGIFYTIFRMARELNEYLECQKLIEFLQSLQHLLNPNLVIFFSVQPEVAIERRGGREGRLVNLSFLNNYNKLLSSFKSTIDIPKYSIDTSSLSKEDVTDEVFNAILETYKANRRI